MTEFLLIFIGLSIVNVVFSTIRSIVTIKGGKWTAALMSGGYFAFYNIVMMWTVADFPMWQKCLITFVCNVIGVYLVKWGEEKSYKDKLWKIETSVLRQEAPKIKAELDRKGIDNQYIDNIGKYAKFEILSETQAQSIEVRNILKPYKVKYFVSESKSLE